MGALASLPLTSVALLLVLAVAAYSYRLGQQRAATLAKSHGGHSLHSRPHYHGWYVALWAALPALLLLSIFAATRGRLTDALVIGTLPDDVKALPTEQLQLFLSDAYSIAFGGTPSTQSEALSHAAQTFQMVTGVTGLLIALVAVALAIGAVLFALRHVTLEFRARTRVEAASVAIMVLSAGLAILTTIGIVMSLLVETLRFFQFVSPIDFLFGLQWSPQIAIRADQIGSSGAFGAVPLFTGTFLIMVIAMVVAVPVGLGAAVYLSEYASNRARQIIKPILEVLAGIPTVVYGFFALLTVSPAVRAFGAIFGIDIPAQSAIAAGLVMGIMIIPFISSLSDDVINAVPQTLRDGSFAMGATKSETVARVVLPAALPGIVGAVLLGVSRALGETMIVAMAAGQSPPANIHFNPLDTVTTVTVQIVTLLTGDQEFDSPKTLSAFALGFVLFTVTLILNVIALRVVQKYREKYD